MSDDKHTADYDNFLTRIEPLILGLQRCSAQLNRDAFWALEDRRDDAERSLESQYELTKTDKSALDAVASFQLKVVDGKTHESVLSIDAAFECHFHIEGGGMNADLATRFVESDLRIVIWPYFRHLAWDITGRMYVPPILIPFAIKAPEHKRRQVKKGR